MEVIVSRETMTPDDGLSGVGAHGEHQDGLSAPPPFDFPG